MLLGLTQLNGKIQPFPLRGIYTAVSMPHRHDPAIWQVPGRSKKIFQPHIGGSSLASVCLNPDGA